MGYEDLHDKVHIMENRAPLAVAHNAGRATLQIYSLHQLLDILISTPLSEDGFVMNRIRIVSAHGYIELASFEKEQL